MFPLCAQTALPQTTVIVDAPTETVIKGALKYLASKQAPNGSWSIEQGGRQLHSVSMTGYTLMAFMAAGNLPEEGPYHRNVTQGVEFLLDTVQADGLFRGVDGSKYMYSHGIATIALSEIYGQARTAAIRPKLESLIRVILASQNKEGGWRYQPRARDADISVSALQVTALRAAKNAGLEVPQETLDRAVDYVGNCYNQESGGFTYQAKRGPPGFARTAAAIYSLQVCGYYDDPTVKTGSDYLFKNAGDKGYWTYGNHYAAPAQYMIGGETWQRWYGRTKELLLKSARSEGDTVHWDLTLDPSGVGPVYCTAVYATILAMPYQYIPLYQR